MLADLYGCDVSTLVSKEGPALGVAILAAVGAGLYPDVPTACEKLVKKKMTQSPNPENVEKYKPYYKLYTKLYQDLKNEFKILGSIE